MTKSVYRGGGSIYTPYTRAELELVMCPYVCHPPSIHPPFFLSHDSRDVEEGQREIDTICFVTRGMKN